jgi:hypothetical protein
MSDSFPLPATPSHWITDRNQRWCNRLGNIPCVHLWMLRQNISHVQPCPIEEQSYHCFLCDLWRTLNLINIFRTEYPYGSDLIGTKACISHNSFAIKRKWTFQAVWLARISSMVLQSFPWPFFEWLLTCVESIGDDNISSRAHIEGDDKRLIMRSQGSKKSCEPINGGLSRSCVGLLRIVLPRLEIVSRSVLAPPPWPLWPICTAIAIHRNVLEGIFGCRQIAIPLQLSSARHLITWRCSIMRINNFWLNW